MAHAARALHDGQQRRRAASPNSILFCWSVATERDRIVLHNLLYGCEVCEVHECQWLHSGRRDVSGRTSHACSTSPHVPCVTIFTFHKNYTPKSQCMSAREQSSTYILEYEKCFGIKEQKNRECFNYCYYRNERTKFDSIPTVVDVYMNK